MNKCDFFHDGMTPSYIVKKLKSFSYNMLHTAIKQHRLRTIQQRMTVNPNLAALMRVIEDNQDKMPEGEYLEAMNALGALHREIPVPAPVVAMAVAMGGGGRPPPSYAASAPLFRQLLQQQPALPNGMDHIERAAWHRVKHDHPEHNGISAEDWMDFPQDVRNQFLREATDVAVNRYEVCCRNPLPTECPFIARHSVGPWRMAGSWECVCGYKGLCRNWSKHEHSERHQDWAKHRTVSRRRIENMKKDIRRDESGSLVQFKPLSHVEKGGIKYFVVSQEKNEWTNPEMYAEIHRSADPNGKWMVHHREYRSRQYVE
jgi:hypothetical protein